MSITNIGNVFDIVNAEPENKMEFAKLLQVSPLVGRSQIENDIANSGLEIIPATSDNPEMIKVI